DPRRVRIAGSRSTDQRSGEKGEIGGPFREPAHQIAVPLLAVGHVDAHRLSCRRQRTLFARADTVQHLVLVTTLLTAVPTHPLGEYLDQPRVMGGEHGVSVPRQ